MVNAFTLFAIIYAVSALKEDIPHERIMGGREVDIREFPYIVSVQTANRKHNCGGVLISDIWVLTAAHCAYYMEDAYFVRAGSNFCESGGQLTLIVTIITHPLFLETGKDNDIALLKLLSPITFEVTQPIKISSKVVVLTGLFVTIAGWGSADEETEYKDKLMAVQVKVHPNEKCKENAEDAEEEFTKNLFCAGRNGQDTCSLDSGGPAVVGEYLVGLTIFGKSCADPHYPGVYFKIRNFIPWIKNHTGIQES